MKILQSQGDWPLWWGWKKNQCHSAEQTKSNAKKIEKSSKDIVK